MTGRFLTSSRPWLEGAVRRRFRRATLPALLALVAVFPWSSRIEGPPRLLEPDAAWVRSTLASLTLREKIGQLVKIRVPGTFLNRRSPEFLAIEDQVRRNHIGGLVLFAGQVYESAALLNDLQRASKLPLIVAADFERGVAFRIPDATSFPWTMALGATGSEELAYQEGAITAEEARALGIHWVYAPVLDVNNNPDNPVINVRSFGEDPGLVARLGAAFIRGCREHGALATAKHFPGHGDTATDSHIGLAVVHSDAARLDAVELVPFRSAIAAGVDSIMTAHVAVPRVTGERDVPGTLSSRVLTGLLRERLQFEGLVVTDALEMGAIKARYWGGETAVRALQAGADMLLLPPNADVAINEVERAVRRGEISEARIERSVEKVLAAKSRVGLARERTVALDRLASDIGSPEHKAVAAEIANRSVTLVKDERKLLPIDPRRPPRIFSLALAADLDAAPAAVFQAAMRQRFPSVQTMGLDARAPEDLIARAHRNAAEADVIVVATVVRVVSGKGSIGLPETTQSLLGKLIASRKPLVWVALGNPYLLRHFPQAGAYLCTFSTSEPSQAAAAQAIAGEIPIAGKLPVSIPGQAQLGAGLVVPKLEMTLVAGAADGGPAKAAFGDTGRRLAGLVEKKLVAGAALAVGHRGRVVFEAAAGSPAPPGAQGGINAKLGPLSAGLGAVTAALVLSEQGDLILDSAVVDYLPEFRGPGKERVKVRHLLEQTSGLPEHSAGLAADPGDAGAHEALVARACAVALAYEPGAETRPSDADTLLLGEIAARSSGKPLEQFLTELLEPLGFRSGRGAGVSLADVARDTAVFAQMLGYGGIYDHRRYLRRETVDRLRRVADPARAGARPWGWRKPAAGNWTGAALSPSAFGHRDSAGTVLWIDPERELFIVLLATGAPAGILEEAERGVVEAVARALPAARAGRAD